MIVFRFVYSDESGLECNGTRIKIIYLCPLAENLDLDRNEECAKELYGGDMKFTEEQRAVIEGRTRGSITNKRWPNGVVVYKIESSLCKYYTILLE